jgi:hypothetical protein
MGEVLSALQAQYIFLTVNLADFLAACPTQDLRDAIQTQYVACRRSYFASVNTIFHDDDPAISSLVTQMKTAQASLEQTVEDLNNIAKVVDGITQAVTIGVKLAGMAG